MTNRDQLALSIFLKRLPAEPLLEANFAWFEAKAAESYKLADMFLAQRKSQSKPVVLEGEGEHVG